MRSGTFSSKLRGFLLALSVTVGISGFIIAETAQAQISLSNPSWSSLTNLQKDTLASLESDWSTLPPDLKLKWIQVANRFETRSEADRELLKSRMIDWLSLSQKDRRLARTNYLASLEIPNEKKSLAWDNYQKLSPEEKQQLADEVAQKNKARKPSLVNSPSLKN